MPTQGPWRRVEFTQRKWTSQSPTEDSGEREKGQELSSWQRMGIFRKSNRTGVTAKPGVTGRRRMTRARWGRCLSPWGVTTATWLVCVQPSSCSNTTGLSYRCLSPSPHIPSLPSLGLFSSYGFCCLITSVGHNPAWPQPAFSSKRNLHLPVSLSTSLQLHLHTWVSGDNVNTIRESRNKDEVLFFKLANRPILKRIASARV